MRLNLNPTTPRSLVESCREYAESTLKPAVPRWEQQHESAESELRQTLGAGLSGLLLPPEHGGLGLAVETASCVLEELAAAHLPFAFAIVVHANLCNAIARRGTPGQRQQLLERLLTGAAIGAFCLTETSAGSDPAAIATTATPCAEGWQIDGTKAWVSNGAYADILSVYAQTDHAAGSRGIAAFLVDTRAHPVSRCEPYRLLGGQALATTSITFDAVKLPPQALFAPPGEGFKAALAGIDLARILLSAMCCGVLRDALAIAVSYSNQRVAFNRPIARFQGLQWSLADVATELAAARALAMHAARTFDTGGDTRLLAAQAKKFATRVSREGVASCMQVLGATALHDDHPLRHHLASSLIAENLDGTSGIQNVVIARELWQ